MRLLRTKVDGEVHIISFLGKCTKLWVKNALVNVKSDQKEFKKIDILCWYDSSTKMYTSSNSEINKY